jgi:high-affinity Fe2+/Pb2+ permease
MAGQLSPFHLDNLEGVAEPQVVVLSFSGIYSRYDQIAPAAAAAIFSTAAIFVNTSGVNP